MESSKTVTSIFIVVALVAMAALAISVDQKSGHEIEPISPPLPGLIENLHSMENFTGFPASHIRSVRMIRTNGEELAVIREMPDSSKFQFETVPPKIITPYSALLFANASLLDGLHSDKGFVVTGVSDEKIITKLTYSSFDGLILKLVVFTAEDATWLRMVASYSEKLATRYQDITSIALLSDDEIIEITRSLNDRIYKQPDN